MRVRIQRRLLLGFAVTAVPVVLASAAYACQSTVTLYANPSTVAQGASTNVTGNKYNPSLPVEIHLDTRTGPVLATTTAAALNPANGSGVAVTIPASAKVGYHILIATQYNASGVPCTGCPGRATVKVVSASTAAAATAGVSNGIGVGGAGLVANPFGLPGLLLASLGVFAVRRHRRQAVSAG